MNNYAKEWRLAGYPKGMGSESFLPAPPKGFIRVYHFTSPNHVTRSIEHSRLKVARFSDTNDPFELMGLMLREKGIRQAIKDFKKRCNNDKGLLCFSTNWANPLLWSHYAAGHTGVCFGFDLKEGMARRVLYEEKRLMAIVDKNRGRFVIDGDLKLRIPGETGHPFRMKPATFSARPEWVADLSEWVADFPEQVADLP